ncbi:guanylate kinase [Sulfuricurvum kujiense DSM 16994]|uniref:Guanylate kinase n=1 Tax=Sulfuricurvum kujiense (strain ATCC BAA-921 / DSM 16994 / JCM 11577 / YK-1) TaxID=709032 RepID=E4TXZ5_SULKY|nr:guanylate kinase [Sulfuricurvum kujiense]ADR32908.1 guanylate kinase [Sulfuricurvum kujiense DSM 16994]
MNRQSGAILVLSGPSGAGKSSLIQKIKDQIGPIYFSISTTTRPIREGEVDGVHYYFVGVEEFKRDIEDEMFLEYAVVHGNYYGTSLGPVKKALKEGKLVIFDIDVQGHDAVQNRLSDITTSVFITTPSLEELKRRLYNRSTDSEEVILGRIEMAKREVQRISEYDFLIVNDNLEEAAEILVSIAKAARMKIPTFQINEFVQTWEAS